MKETKTFNFPTNCQISNVNSIVKDNQLTVEVELKCNYQFQNSELYKVTYCPKSTHPDTSTFLCIFDSFKDGQLHAYASYFLKGKNSLHFNDDVCDEKSIIEVTTPTEDERNEMNIILEHEYRVKWDSYSKTFLNMTRYGDIVEFEYEDDGKIKHAISVYPVLKSFTYLVEDNQVMTNCGLFNPQQIVTPISQSYIKLYNDAIAQYGIYYNNYLNSLEPLRPRVKDQMYFKYNKHGEIVKRKDTFDDESTCDYESRNYYQTIIECIAYKENIINYLFQLTTK